MGGIAIYSTAPVGGGGGGGSQDLAAVLTVGNTANNTIILDDGAGNINTLGPDSAEISDPAGDANNQTSQQIALTSGSDGTAGTFQSDLIEFVDGDGNTNKQTAELVQLNDSTGTYEAILQSNFLDLTDTSDNEANLNASSLTITNAAGDNSVLQAKEITFTNGANTGTNIISATGISVQDIPGLNFVRINEASINLAGIGSGSTDLSVGNIIITDGATTSLQLTNSLQQYESGFGNILSIINAAFTGTLIHTRPAKSGTYAMVSDIPGTPNITQVLTAGSTVAGSALELSFVAGSVSRSDISSNGFRFEVISGNNPQISIGISGSQPLIAYSNGVGGILQLTFPSGIASTIAVSMPSSAGTLALLSNIPVLVSGVFTITGSAALTYTFAHGLGYSPSFVAFTPQTAGAQLAWYTWDATNFTIHFTVAPGVVPLTYGYQSTK